MKSLVPCALLLALSACSPSGEEDSPPHVLFIVVDTLRVDHTGLGGYERDTTPGIDALAKEGTAFQSHFANAPWTKPSVASIMTGLLPPAHGCQWGDLKRSGEGEVDLLAQGLTTLPEVLRENGWSTVAFITNETLTPKFGYDQGFERYEIMPGTLVYDQQATEAAAETLDAATGPTFIWCHLMAPHNYEFPAQRARTFESEGQTPITDEHPAGDTIRSRYGMHSREQAIDTYDETVLFIDEHVTRLITRVREKHPDTLIVFTSDHGEELGDHGGYLHSRTLFNELLHVPLVVWGPGFARGETVTRLTQSVDLFPTVVDFLGLPEAPTQGRSLLDDSPANEEVYAEKLTGNKAKRALIAPTGKLIENKPPSPDGVRPTMKGKGRWMFFADPTGRDDVDAESNPSPRLIQRGAARINELWEFSRTLNAVQTEGEATQGTLTEEELEALRRLGYVE